MQEALLEAGFLAFSAGPSLNRSETCANQRRGTACNESLEGHFVRRAARARANTSSTASPTDRVRPRRERERAVVSTATGGQTCSTETFGKSFDAWLRNRRPAAKVMGVRSSSSRPRRPTRL